MSPRTPTTYLRICASCISTQTQASGEERGQSTNYAASSARRLVAGCRAYLHGGPYWSMLAHVGPWQGILYPFFSVLVFVHGPPSRTTPDSTVVRDGADGKKRQRARLHPTAGVLLASSWTSPPLFSFSRALGLFSHPGSHGWASKRARRAPGWSYLTLRRVAQRLVWPS